MILAVSGLTIYEFLYKKMDSDKTCNYLNTLFFENTTNNQINDCVKFHHLYKIKK